MAQTNASKTHGPRVTKATKAHIDEEFKERRHEEYGGFKFGAAFFGWLVATGLTAILTSLVVASGTTIALTKIETPTDVILGVTEVTTIGYLGAALLLLVSALSYYAGGYVAGRMARFDGARQGIGVWVISVLAVILAALAGVVLGAKYNLLQQLSLPHVPIDAGDMTLGGTITLLLILGLTLAAAILGGKAGQRYHNKIDRAGI